MKNKNETISRREALKRMSKAIVVVASATVLPNVGAIASDTNRKYYANYYNYSNYSNYYNYSNYSNYYNYVNRSR